MTKGLGEHLVAKNRAASDTRSESGVGVFGSIARIEIRQNQLAVWLQPADAHEAGDETARGAPTDQPPSLIIPWTKPPAKRFKDILLPASTHRHMVRPIKFERRAALLKAIARGRAWLEAIVSGAATVDDLAAHNRCSVRHINMTISLAFVAPALVKAAVEGRLPRGIGVASLRDAPIEWSHQFERLGLGQS